MKTTLSKEEFELVKNKVNEFIKTGEEIYFTGTTISPHNLRFMLTNKFGFNENDFESNDMDFWWSFIHKDIGLVTMEFCAYTFELKLYKEDDDD